uniref:Immulectin 12 n=1 Tax=Hepialus xiaojinensis TaxID=1589740 RepID=A0A219YXH5_9NEOP|nr:immulectin 12 [Hepialus xiaojinensis]
MMFRILLILSCYLIAAITMNQESEPTFRPDYKYVDSEAAFYRLNINPMNWTEARSTCQEEGASLVVPENQSEIDILVELIKSKSLDNARGVFMGIHDMFLTGTFLTINGQEMSEVFENWASDQPNRKAGKANCVFLHRNSKYYDGKCKSKLPFICKKTLDTLTEQPLCETSDVAYFPDATETRCYKLHLKPKTWSKAFATCRAEQGYLAIINDEEEANILKNKLAEHPKRTLKGDFNKDHVFLGFHDRFTAGEFITVFGTSLSETGFTQWAPRRRNNRKNRQHCGGLMRNGFLDDINCSSKCMFFCERELGDANTVDIFSRFQDIEPETS